jgi:hypothetical protein
VEDTLVKDGTFALPGKKVLKRKSNSSCGCHGKPRKLAERRPKRVLKRYTLKTQVIIERNTLEILDVYEAKGSEHDCKMYKDSIGKSVSSSIPVDADLGFQGIKQYHPNSFIPVKASKNHQMTEEEKAYNKELAGRRVVIEHINVKIKTFRCMSYPYREHRQNRHSLRMALICGLINYDRLV